MLMDTVQQIKRVREKVKNYHHVARFVGVAWKNLDTGLFVEN